ncbi:uncharacterized protein LOC122335186 [Puntigrus tetrazona]|uniref:uncharacterized protein LOC122335186 n=1 Tax=Puntigrus tetrazona TaxID=1606681 RepID=UPI001C8B082C|nr:uncharacterized protein LOC122335186 [Puntigrus tetrazona]
MLKRFNLLLLLGLFDYSGTNVITVKGKKGGNATLSCEIEAKDIYYVELSRLKSVVFCQNEERESESQNGRVFRNKSCDVIITDLRLSDAGKYILKVFYTDTQTEVKEQTSVYRLHFHGEISVKKGEELKLDVLLSNAYKVVHWTKRGTGEKEDWIRGRGVRSHRVTFRDGNLIINNFTATDAGTYEVLDTEGGILIMLTIKESKKKINDTNGESRRDTSPPPDI